MSRAHGGSDWKPPRRVGNREEVGDAIRDLKKQTFNISNGPREKAKPSGMKWERAPFDPEAAMARARGAY